MNNQAKKTAGIEVVLHLHSIEQMLISPNSLFYGKRMLNKEAEDLIMEGTTFTPRRDGIFLKIVLPEAQIARAEEVAMAIHQHFSYRKEKSETQLKRCLTNGLRSFLIALVFISLLVLLVLAIGNLLPDGEFLTTIREIFIILGWVALWRPAEYLLYEWRPLKQETRLFGKLEQCKVEIVPECGSLSLRI